MTEDKERRFNIGDKAKGPTGEIGIVKEQYYDLYRHKWKARVYLESLSHLSPTWFDENDLETVQEREPNK